MLNSVINSLLTAFHVLFKGCDTVNYKLQGDAVFCCVLYKSGRGINYLETQAA